MTDRRQLIQELVVALMARQDDLELLCEEGARCAQGQRRPKTILAKPSSAASS